MLRAPARTKLAGRVKLLAARAVEATVRTLVDVAALATGLPEALGAAPVTHIGAGPDEVVEGQVETLLERQKARSVLFDELRDRNAGPIGGLDVLYAVLVCPCLEAHLIAAQPVEPRQRIGLDHLQGKAQMRRRVHIGNGGGDVAAKAGASRRLRGSGRRNGPRIEQRN